MAKPVNFDTLRSLGFASISGTYAAVGAALAVPDTRIMCITNKTQGDMLFSTDATNSDGMLVVPAGSFKLFDLTANAIPGKDDGFFLRIGTIWYVKQITAPTSGAVYIEYLYGAL
jgi:hypothetical protein